MSRVGPFFLGIVLSLLLVPLVSEGQQPAKVPRIGFLGGSREAAGHLHQAFLSGLRELGWVEGQNIAVEYRWAEGKIERFPELAAELVRLRVDAILVPTTQAALAAKQATRTIPIVLIGVGDPVGTGLVASLARPGGNITGLSFLAPELSAKQLELLKEAVPKVSRVAVLVNPTNPVHALMLREMGAAARSLGVQLQPLEARSPDELDGAFGAMARARAGALVVSPDVVFFLHRTRLATLAAQSRLPAVYGITEHAQVGGLMAYAPNYSDLFRRAATYVDKILKGAKPGDLPIEQPTKFELVINLKTARALGLTIPQSLLIRADQVIQ